MISPPPDDDTPVRVGKLIIITNIIHKSAATTVPYTGIQCGRNRSLLEIVVTASSESVLVVQLIARSVFIYSEEKLLFMPLL